jgi:hypothetical protein
MLAMPYRDLEPLSKQLTIVVGLTVVGFMTFGLALSFYRNVLFDQTLDNLRAQNDKLRAENGEGQMDLQYLQSAQYKDKYAKENFGKINRGEKVLVITDNSPVTVSGEEEQKAADQQRDAVFEQYLRQMPVIEHWKIYLFDHAKMEELRKSLTTKSPISS